MLLARSRPLFCALALTLSLAACGKKDPDTGDGAVVEDMSGGGTADLRPVDAATPGDAANPAADLAGGGDGGMGVVCTSGSRWTNGTTGSVNMEPGHACIDCHRTRPRAPVLTVAGTVYPTLREALDCNAGAQVVGATVEVTDSRGTKVSLPVNQPSGNFRTLAALTPPLTVRVLFNGKANAMKGMAPSGDCNSCHTETGANGAPGRITIP